MTANSLLVPALVLAIAVVARRLPPMPVGGRWLEARWTPPVLGVVTALLVWYTWGSLQAIGVSHDERSYLLQAQVFASGRWTAPGPPLPEFFEQFHVLVTPVLASKYPPGHALILAPGALLGLPGLMPVLLSGITAGLLFATARRVTNPWVAILMWLFWTTGAENLRWRASYYSETTTSLLVALAWWCTLQWMSTRERRWLVCIAAAVGWGAITRPLTMLVFALPLGAVLLVELVRRRMWRDIGVAVATTTAFLLVVPVWSAATTGRWDRTPLAQYTETYIPWDRMGFGYDSTSPARVLPPDLQRVAGEFITLHREHTLEALPGQLRARAYQLRLTTWRGWRLGLMVFFVLGVLTMPRAVAFALGSSALLLLAYAVYAHQPEWTLYYVEALPVLALLTALGMWRALSFIVAQPGSAARPIDPRSGVATAVLLCAVLGASRMWSDVRSARELVSTMSLGQRTFIQTVDRLPHDRVIVFVRHPPRYLGHFSLVGNEPDRDRARAWIVYDRGEENRALLALVPDRVPYLYDQARQTILPLAPDTAAR